MAEIWQGLYYSSSLELEPEIQPSSYLLSCTGFLPTCNTEQSQTHSKSVHLRSQRWMENFMDLGPHIP